MAALSLLALWVSASAAELSAATPHSPWPLVIGHRGLGQDHAPEPENSILALVKAFQRGASAVEFDVQLSADGEVMLAHDAVLDRISSGHGCVGDATYAELRSMMLKDGIGVIHRDLTFGTFREALRAIKRFDSPSRPFLADVHIKVFDLYRGDWGGIDNHGCPVTDVDQLSSKIVRIAKEEGMMDRLIFTSFDARPLERILSAVPSARTGLLTMVRPELAIEQARGRFEFVALNKDHLCAEDVETAHRAGLKVFVWSPKAPSDLTDELERLHVDGVITDDVDAAVVARAAL